MSGLKQILRVGSTALVVLSLLAACSTKEIARVEHRGYVEAKPVGDQIKVGKSTKDDIRRLLGSPSTVSAFPPETWYYITRRNETVAFLQPEVVDQKVARVEFDDNGKVAKFENFDFADSREIEFVERETPTEGRTLGLMEQLLGNLGRFNTPRDATEARQ